MGQQFNFSLRLHLVGFLGLDDLDGDLSSTRHILCANDLPKRSFSYPLFNSIAIMEELVGSNNVIIVLIIPPIVVGALTLLGLFFRSGGSTGFSLLIVHRVDAFVCFNERDG